MKINKKVCRIITFGQHWFRHYPGEKRYVRCRLCGRLPKSMFVTLFMMQLEQERKKK